MLTAAIGDGASLRCVILAASYSLRHTRCVILAVSHLFCVAVAVRALALLCVQVGRVRGDGTMTLLVLHLSDKPPSYH